MTMYTKDIAGREVTEGTKVAFVAPNSHCLLVGVVERVDLNYVKVRWGKDYTTRRKADQFVSIEE